MLLPFTFYLLPLWFFFENIRNFSLNYLIKFFMLSFCAFVFTIMSLLCPIFGLLLHENLPLLWWVTSSMNNTDPLFLWFLQTVSIFSCDFQNDSSQRCWMRQFLFPLFWTTMTGLGIICHGMLSLIILSGTFIENFYSFHILEKICGFYIIYFHPKTKIFNMPRFNRPLETDFLPIVLLPYSYYQLVL